MERDSVIPGNSGSAQPGGDPAGAATFPSALDYLDKLIALQDAAHQTPRMKAILGRDVAREAASVTVACLRGLDALARRDREPR